MCRCGRTLEGPVATFASRTMAGRGSLVRLGPSFLGRPCPPAGRPASIALTPAAMLGGGARRETSSPAPSGARVAVKSAEGRSGAEPASGEAASGMSGLSPATRR